MICLSGGLMLAMIGGCAAQERQQAEFFAPQGRQAVESAAAVQAAGGAREDGMLRAIHFDGDALNSLGRWKLDQMAEGIGQGQLKVYLDVPETGTADEGHRQVVLAYLHEKGLRDEQIQVKQGVNPEAFSSTSAGLSRLSKTENPGPNDNQEKSGQSATLMQAGIMTTSP
jgi:hypothetical protein